MFAIRYLITLVGISLPADQTSSHRVQGGDNGGNSHTNPADDVRIPVVAICGCLRLL